MAMHGWTAEEAWRRMTVEAAYVLGLQLRIGSLSPGLEADFVQWTLPVEAPGSLAETLLLPTTQWTASYVAGMPLAQVALSY
jgi:cytosine/adenosine deaminase-related metal-dependent hydrolase